MADDDDARDDLVATLREMAAGDISARERRTRELALDTLRLMAVAQLEAWGRVRTSQGDPAECSSAAFLADVLSRACAGFDVTLQSRN